MSNEWILPLISIILSAIAIIIAIVLNWWTLNHENRLRDKRVRKLYKIIEYVFKEIKDIEITIPKNGTFNLQIEDIILFDNKKHMFSYFRDDWKYIFFDESDKNEHGFLCSFYGSVNIWLNRISCKKDFFDFRKEIKDIRITDILPRLLDKIKKDCKKYWGIDLE